MNSTFKCRNFFIMLMYKAAKYALDFMFLFMLIVSTILFGLGFFVDIHGPALDILHKMDFVILGGYYAFFAHGVFKSKNKVNYCKQHWLMLAFLLLPLVPVARLVKFAELERATAVGLNTLWHFFDELGLL